MIRPTALCVALATVLGGTSPLPVSATPIPALETADGSVSFVVVPPGIYAGEQPGRRMVHDYGAFQLWRVDAAHRSELAATAREVVRFQPTAVGFEAAPLPADRRAAGADIPAAFRAASKPEGSYLQVVQFAGPVIDAWLDPVRATGAVLVQPLSGNAYLVFADAAAAQSLSALRSRSGHLLQVTALEPFYKLSSELAEGARNGFDIGATIDITVQIVKHAGNAISKQTIAGLAGSGITPVWSDRLALESASVSVDAASLETIAGLNDVAAIEIRHPRRLFDEVQAQILAANFDGTRSGPSGPGYLAWLTALGFSTDPADYPIVDIVDDGLGDGSAANAGGDRTLRVDGDLANDSRVQYIVNCTIDASGDGVGGHGHINTSIVGGADQTGSFPWTDDNGFLRAQGINPFTRLAHTKIFRNSGPYNIANCGSTDPGVIKSSQDNGAAITSNSWGASVAGDYDDSSQAYDIGTRDGDLTEAGNQPMIHIFAAGNQGSGASTVGSPATGKNVISVGASENDRPSDESGAWTDGCLVGPTGADNAMDVIGFSSRGPAEGGRVKPEVIAPGTHIQGTASTNAGYTGDSVCDQFRPGSQTLIAASSGTSHSTPAISGVASLVYRWLQTEYGLAMPSAAMLKAYLMAHPTYLSGVGANDNVPSNSQGYGMPDMGAMFDVTTDRVVQDQATTFGGAGETHTWVGAVADTGKPLRIALAWSDAPGAISDTTPQVNDLDLVVEVDGETYLGNRFTGQFSSTGGSADTANNYEAVFLPAGTSGAITVTVTAQVVNGDGIPNNADGTDQDFALVCSNCLSTPIFGVDAAPESQAVCAGDVPTWDVDVAALNGYTGTVTLSVIGAPSGAGTSFTVNPVAAPGPSELSMTTAGVATGGYFFDVSGEDGSFIRADNLGLQVDSAAPAAPLLSTPADAAVDVATSPTLTWAAATGALGYEVEVDDDPAFGSVDYSASVAATSHTVAATLTPLTTYYWRVRASNGCGQALSVAFTFTTGAQICANPTVAIPDNSEAGVDSDLVIAPLGTLTDLDLSTQITHSWVGDLIVTLTHVDTGTSASLIDRPGVPASTFGCSGDDIDAVLDDEAGAAVETQCAGSVPTIAGSFTPNDPLSVFDGESLGGTWRVNVSDRVGSDTGALVQWCLDAQVTAPGVVAADDAVQATEDTQLNVPAPGVLGNDSGSGLSASVLATPANGVLIGGAINADGSFSYLPDPDLCGLAADSFSYTASDGVESDTATVTIDIACVNDAPVADQDAYVINEDSVLDVDAPGVLDGDSDVDGDPLTATNPVQPANGVVVLAADGGFSYTPAADYCNDGAGTDNFTYTANDGIQDSVVAAVQIAVNCVNDAPTAIGTPTDLELTEGDAVDRNMAGFFTDVDGDVLQYTATGLPAGLSLDPATGQIAGTVTFGGSGGSPYTVVVTATDPDLDSAMQSFSISVASAGPVDGDLFGDGFEL